MSVLGFFAATTDMVVSHMITMRMAIVSIIKYLSLWFLSKIKFMSTSLIVVRGLGRKITRAACQSIELLFESSNIINSGSDARNSLMTLIGELLVLLCHVCDRRLIGFNGCCDCVQGLGKVNCVCRCLMIPCGTSGGFALP